MKLVKTLLVMNKAIDWWIIFSFLRKGVEHFVPNNQDASIVSVYAIRIPSMMNSMIGRGVEDDTDWP